VLDDVLARGAYRVELRSSPAGGMHAEWVGREGDREVRYSVEPKSTAWQRWRSGLYSLLPIEPLL